MPDPTVAASTTTADPAATTTTTTSTATSTTADPAATASSTGAGTTILAAADPAKIAADPAAATTTTTAGDPTKTGTTADPAKAADPAAVEAKWPDDWREKYAGDDAKKLEQLKRYGSPQAALDALFEARKTISQGVKGSTLKADATPEEVAEFRKANGIPEKATDYDVNLPDGLVIGEGEKPYVDKFLEQLHSKNASPEMVKDILTGYYKLNAEATAQFEGYKQQQQVENDTQLKAEWGKGYQKNLNVVAGYLQKQYGEAGDIIANAYDSNGLPLANNATVLRKLLANALDHDPIGTLVPGAGMSGADNVDNEIQALEKRMTTDRAAWFKDEKSQARYRDLVSARERIKKK